MVRLKGWVWLLAGAAAGQAFGTAQVLNNQYLTGKYYFRQVSLGAASQASISDARSVLGVLTFDGAGNFTFTGQQVLGNSAAAAVTGKGNYSVDPAGLVTMESPLRAGSKVNARVGPEALLGSSTESADNTFDLLVAIPAPTKAPVLAGAYWTATLEFPAGAAANVRNTMFSLQSAGTAGRLADFSVAGHAANLAGGAPVTQAMTGATYLLNTDGTGAFTFGPASNAVLLSGGRTVYVSASGNVILGGSTASGAHDILIGVKAVSGATNATWSGDYWGAGLRFGPTDSAPVSSFSGSVAARGLGFVTWSRRYKGAGAGTFDFTGINRYTLKSDGSAAVELAQLGLGPAGFVGSAIDARDPDAYEIYFGAAMAPVSGTGVFLHPRGIVNTASYAPAGSPIAPGEFITLFGSGLARGAQQISALPFPFTLNGVTVTIQGRPAPLYYVAADRIYAVVPYATQGPNATVTVQNQNGASNSVTVPVASTAPGIFSLDQTGAGSGAILHSDFSVVNAGHPATRGETIQIYLTGLGVVTPTVTDGAAGRPNPLSLTNIQPSANCADNTICVLIGGLPAVISYAGLAPGLPGVYQINATVPVVPSSGNLPLAILTPTAFHDQVYLLVQ
jgi:uncharacterized protein (TIGR03437 family)